MFATVTSPMPKSRSEGATSGPARKVMALSAEDPPVLSGISRLAVDRSAERR